MVWGDLLVEPGENGGDDAGSSCSREWAGDNSPVQLLTEGGSVCRQGGVNVEDVEEGTASRVHSARSHCCRTGTKLNPCPNPTSSSW